MRQPQQDPDAGAPDSLGQPTDEPRGRDIGRRLEDKQRVQTDMALRASEARFRVLVDGIHDYAIFMLGPNGHVTSWNRGATRIFGYQPNEIIGHHLDTFHLESDREVLLASEHLRLAERFGRFEEEGWRARKDGARFWSQGSVSALFDDSGLIGFAVVIRDLSERVEAEDDIKRSEARFRALIEHASDCIAIVDPDLLVKYASPSHEQTIGYSCADLENKSLATHVHRDDLDRLRSRMQMVLATPEETAKCEIRIQHRSGAWRSVSVVLKNLLHHTGIDGIILTLQDVTERNMLEAQLRQAQKMDAVGQLAGGVAHDFNNLLTVIKGNLELLTLDLDSARTNAELDEIRKAAERAAGLTRQLLAFSRKQLLHARATDVNEIVTELEPMLRRLIGNDVQVAPILAPKLPPVMIDPSQMHQVLMNLAVNARDAMPGGGVLIIETSTLDVDERYLEGHAGVKIPPGCYVQISMTDDGVGMSEDVRARLFEPFFTTKDAGKGSGLGLATVYGIVKQSGGFVWVNSEPGVGSTFQVLLPSAGAGAVAENAPAGLAKDGHGIETILLVEDEEPLRKLAKRVLERYGYRVLTALNGQDAKRIASGFQGSIDLLLTDVVMPGMGGRELADWLQGQRPETRLLYMSGYTDDEIIRRGLNDPSLALLEKPFSPGDLVKTVRQVLDVPSSVAR